MQSAGASIEAPVICCCWLSFEDVVVDGVELAWLWLVLLDVGCILLLVVVKCCVAGND